MLRADVKLKTASFLCQAGAVDPIRAAEPEHVPPSWRRPLWGESVTTDSYVCFHILCRRCVTLPTVGLNYFPTGNSWFYRTTPQPPVFLLLCFDTILLLKPSLPLQCKLLDASSSRSPDPWRQPQHYICFDSLAASCIDVSNLEWHLYILYSKVSKKFSTPLKWFNLLLKLNVNNLQLALL